MPSAPIGASVRTRWQWSLHDHAAARSAATRYLMLLHLPQMSGHGEAPLGLPLVPALEEGASKCSVEQVEHQQVGRRFLVDLDPLGVEREDREDVAVPPRRRVRASLARSASVRAGCRRLVPASAAKDASLAIRRGSPLDTSSCAAQTTPTPHSPSRPGASRDTSSPS
jgi:hypothetical protein